MTQQVHAGDSQAGIIMQEGCLQRGDCKLEIYQTLQIREDTAGKNSLQFFVQDIFLSATFFIGTMAAIGLIISGVMMVFGGANESMYENGKKGMKYSIIGILLVVLSYTLIRAVQFVAQWNR